MFLLWSGLKLKFSIFFGVNCQTNVMACIPYSADCCFLLGVGAKRDTTLLNVSILGGSLLLYVTSKLLYPHFTAGAYYLSAQGCPAKIGKTLVSLARFCRAVRTRFGRWKAGHSGTTPYLHFYILELCSQGLSHYAPDGSPLRFMDVYMVVLHFWYSLGPTMAFVYVLNICFCLQLLLSVDAWMVHLWILYFSCLYKAKLSNKLC